MSAGTMWATGSVSPLSKEAVEWPLKNPESYRDIGVEAPKGVLLYGPPGTGKTLLAKAIAHESDANFITAKGSDLLSKWYGESEKRIAEVFMRARQVAPSIVFLDELDSLAPIRGISAGEPQVTARILNQLLPKWTGSKNSGVWWYLAQPTALLILTLLSSGQDVLMNLFSFRSLMRELEGKYSKFTQRKWLLQRMWILKRSFR